MSTTGLTDGDGEGFAVGADDRRGVVGVVGVIGVVGPVGVVAPAASEVLDGFVGFPAPGLLPPLIGDVGAVKSS